jgi:hypothetical protein
MRKITKQVAEAFERNRSLKVGNSEVKSSLLGAELYLHGNKIAWMSGTCVLFSLCGYNTPTTRERLQAAGVRVAQRNFQVITLQDVYSSFGVLREAGGVICPDEVYCVKQS